MCGVAWCTPSCCERPLPPFFLTVLRRRRRFFRRSVTGAAQMSGQSARQQVGACASREGRLPSNRKTHRGTRGGGRGAPLRPPQASPPAVRDLTVRCRLLVSPHSRFDACNSRSAGSASSSPAQRARCFRSVTLHMWRAHDEWRAPTGCGHVL